MCAPGAVLLWQMLTSLVDWLTLTLNRYIMKLTVPHLQQHSTIISDYGESPYVQHASQFQPTERSVAAYFALCDLLLPDFKCSVCSLTTKTSLSVKLVCWFIVKPFWVRACNCKCCDGMGGCYMCHTLYKIPAWHLDLQSYILKFELHTSGLFKAKYFGHTCFSTLPVTLLQGKV